MGRWSYLDTDEARLPDGMKRVGYDADTQTYTFLDTADGTYWESAPGCVYGKLFRVRDTASPLDSVTIDEDMEGDEPEPELKEGEWEPPTPDSIPRRQDSLVRKFVNRWNSIRASRISSASSATLVDEPSEKQRIPEDERSRKDRKESGESSHPTRSPTTNESNEGLLPTKGKPQDAPDPKPSGSAE